MKPTYNSEDKNPISKKFLRTLLKIERGKMSAFKQIWFWRSDYGGIQANNQLP